MVLKRAGLIALALLCSVQARAQQRPSFSGTWRRDSSQSPPRAFGPPDWTIQQTDHELILETGGQVFAFTPDGAEHVYVDTSLGDLPNFVRKIRTKAF